MAYTRNADGIASKGKTKGKNFGNNGVKVLGMKGGKKVSGVSSESMKALGRNMARIANQG